MRGNVSTDRKGRSWMARRRVTVEGDSLVGFVKFRNAGVAKSAVSQTVSCDEALLVFRLIIWQLSSQHPSKVPRWPFTWWFKMIVNKYIHIIFFLSKILWEKWLQRQRGTGLILHLRSKRQIKLIVYSCRYLMCPTLACSCHLTIASGTSRFTSKCSVCSHHRNHRQNSSKWIRWIR